MTTVEFLTELHARKIHLWVEGETLKCRAPKGALTPEVREGLAERKLEILALLQGNDLVRRSAVPPPARIPRTGELPLSFSQERLWFLHQVNPDSSAYIIVSSLRSSRPLDVSVVQRCLAELVQRHESLRTTFVTRDGAPSIRIAPSIDIHLPLFDLRALQVGERRAEFARIRAEQTERPFDLERGPLVRVALIRGAGDEWALLFALHHIISDRWSLGVITNEFEALYGGQVDGAPVTLPGLPLQYVDFAAWQRERLQGSMMEGQLTYWREQLAGELAVIDLPADRPRPSEQTHRGAWETRELPPALAQGVRNAAVTAGATPFMVFLAGFTALLHRYTGQDDIL